MSNGVIRRENVESSRNQASEQKEKDANDDSGDSSNATGAGSRQIGECGTQSDCEDGEGGQRKE